MASPRQTALSFVLAESSSAWVITKAIAKAHAPDTERLTVTPCSAASSGSKDCGALSTTTVVWIPRFSFLNSAVMAHYSLQSQRHERTVRVFAVLAKGPAEAETGALIQLLRRPEGRH